MVCVVEEAVMESARLDFRPGVDGALHDDGGGCVAGVAAGWLGKQRKPLLIFLAQLALNALWTPLFFGLHRPGLAFAEIALLWLAIATTLTAFRPVSRVAAWLLAPYLAWVSFAAALNFALWRLNP
jgi:tryptophan-rich sensory protein